MCHVHPGPGKRMLLRRCCPCACPSSSAIGSSKRVTVSFSRYYLVTRPLTGAINCLQSWRNTVHLHRPDIREGGQLLPAARLSVDAQGRSGWRISYRCVLLSICVHHSPKTTHKTSENWKRLSYNKPLQAGRWTVVRFGWPSNAVRVAIFYARCHRQPSMRNSVIVVSQWGSKLSFTFDWAKSQSLARLREIAKVNTRKIIGIPKSQNFVLAKLIIVTIR